MLYEILNMENLPSKSVERIYMLTLCTSTRNPILFLKPQPIEQYQKRTFGDPVYKSNNRSCFDVLQTNKLQVSIKDICTTMVRMISNRT